MHLKTRVKDKIDRKEMVIGTHVSFTNSCFTELLGDVGFDFIWIDAEHGAMDKQDIQLHLIAARASGSASFVRVPWNDPVIVKTVLDMGPDGIVFPMICSAEEAEQAVAACRYPPKGIRGLGTRRTNRYGMGDKKEYFAEVEDRTWKIMQIEHIDGVKDLDRILEVDGVDTIVVGPNDLSGSVGLLGQTKHPEVIALLDEIGDKARKHGTPLGVSMGYDPEVVRQWKERGISWIGMGQDFSLLAKAAKELFAGAKDLLG
jgi:2-dehydro-3-deoxyglucarate aldolase/4-hydroxy-2-oxoheptanedioate aldolase